MRPRVWSRALALDALDAVLALFLTATALYEIWVQPLFDDGIPGPPIANTALLLLVAVPLAARRRAPTVVFVVVVSSVLLQVTLIDAARSSQPPVQEWIALLVAYYSLGAYAERRRALYVFAALGGIFVFRDVLLLTGAGGRIENAAPSWFTLGAAFGLGMLLHSRRLETELLAGRTQQLERDREQQARLAVAEERVRISHELHDTVTHAITVMVVQSQAAQRVLEGEQPSARESLASIETTGRQALAEMRRLLAVVRTPGEQPLLAPRPSLAYLDTLAVQVREAGLPVQLLVEGLSRPLPPSVDLSAYRIIQEALTNTLKHAGPATAQVVVRYGKDSLEVEVSDDGRGPGRTFDGDDLERYGQGHGLIGMRERATLVGGLLEAGANGNLGYRVRARLPA